MLQKLIDAFPIELAHGTPIQYHNVPLSHVIGGSDLSYEYTSKEIRRQMKR